MMTEEYTRLHITPFNPSLLNAILPPSILPNARNISYHDIQTFPEKSYGYVDLPIMDADKIKKKLNGSILKGTKVKIDKARPQKEVVISEAIAEVERPKKEKKKRKRDELPGVDIGERHVKRGWTTPGKDIPKEKLKLIPKSKFTTGPECLFKTVLPPNVASKGKIAEAKPDKKKRRLGKEAVVHEFTKTTKYATFLRNSSGPGTTKAVTEYVNDKGWVDEDGNVVEPAVKSRRSKSKSQVEAKPLSPKIEAVPRHSSQDPEEEDVANGGPVSTEEREASESASGAEILHGDNMLADLPEEEVVLAGPDVESSEAESESESESQITAAELVTEVNKTDSSPISEIPDYESEVLSSTDEQLNVEDLLSTTTSRPSSAIGPTLTIKIPDSISSTPIASSVHPLEALYKRSKKDDSSTPKHEASKFSFFGDDNADSDDIEVETQIQVPLTPFTQKDFEYRGMRSAAPTPDTAHANKRFIWPSNDDDEEDDDDDDGPAASSPIRKNESTINKDAKTGEEESDFQKWFWENRGNVNRAWKKRKRTVSKEKRQRETKNRHVA